MDLNIYTEQKKNRIYISLFRIKYKHTSIYILIHLPIVKISNYSVHLNHRVSALCAVDSVFKLHVCHATAKTAYLKSIKLKVTGSQSTHLTNPVVISYEKCSCRMPRLSNDERNRAVTMLLQGATQQEVATALGVHQTTVHRLQGRLVLFGNTNDRPWSGRLRVTIARQDHLMRLTYLRNRTRTAVETAITTPGTHNHRISAQTVRNRLR